MKLKNGLKRLCVILLLLGLSSCKKITIPDVEVCGDMGSEGAYCYTTNSEQEREITKEDWDIERVGGMCMSGKDFAEIKEAVLKLCNETKKCAPEVKRKLYSFFLHSERL